METAQQVFKKFGAIVLTGGSSGIGYALLTTLVSIEHNSPIFNLSRKKPDIKCKENRFFHYTCDLEVPLELDQALETLIPRLQASSGPVLLVNNSGFGAYGPYPEPELETHLRMVDLNIRAPLNLAGRLLPLFQNRGGAIVNIASTAAFQPTPQLSTYGASKAFLLHWSLSVAEDLKPYGVHVMAVCPGPTRTAFFKRAGFISPPTPPFLSQEPAAVIYAMVQGLKKKKTLVVCGFKNRCIVGLTSLLPKSLAARMAGYVLKKVRKP